VYSEDFDCPFNEDDAETYDQGVLLAYIICFNLCLLTVVMTGFIWKRYWNKEVKELKGRHLATLNDMIIMAGVFIDFCQYLSFGPKFESLNSAIWDLSKGLSIDLSGLIEMSEGVFWIILNCVYSACFVWFVVASLNLLRIDVRYERFSICQTFGYFSEVLLPVLSNACFVPIVGILLDVHLCTESVGDSYNDSFLDRDCHVWCWESEHVIYVTFAVVSFTLYVPLAVLTRPMWQFD
jgi:hypothetical protein